MEITEKFVIGKLVCSGENANGFYYNPFVAIEYTHSVQELNGESVTVSEVDEKTVKIDYKVKMCGTPVLTVPIIYREATRDYDNPTFKMTVYNDDGSIAHKGEGEICLNCEDVRATFNSLDEELLFIFNQGEIKPNTPVTYKCHLEVKLEIKEWTTSSANGQNEDIQKEGKMLLAEKDVIVTIVAERVYNLDVSSLMCVCENAVTNETNWNKLYRLEVHCRNNGNEEVSVAEMRLREYTIPNEIETEENVSIEDHINSFLPYNASKPDTDYKLRSVPIYKNLEDNWQWWSGSGPSLTVAGPTEKKYKCKFLLRLSGEQNYVKRECDIKVLVPGYKIAYLLDSASANQEAWNWVIIAALLSIVSIYYPCVTVLAVAAGFVAAYFFDAANQLFSDAQKCIEYDKDYNEKHDYTSLLHIPEPQQQIPSVIREFNDSIKIVFALKQSIHISYCRYLSALKENDKKAAKQQIASCNDMFCLMEEEIVDLDIKFEQTQRYFTDNPIKIDDATKLKSLDRLKSEGLSEQQKASLIYNGITQDIISAIEGEIQEKKPEDIQLNIPPDIKLLYNCALKYYVASLKEIKDIGRIKTLSSNNILRDLLKKGLISPKEFDKKTKQLDDESEYPIVEIKCINSFYKSKLTAAGIMNSIDLLNRCYTLSDIKKLAKMIGINEKIVHRWVNIADLIRVKNLDENSGDLLMKIGISTSKELQKAKVTDVYNKMKKYAQEIKSTSRLPSKEQIINWIKNARSQS